MFGDSNKTPNQTNEPEKDLDQNRQRVSINGDISDKLVGLKLNLQQLMILVGFLFVVAIAGVWLLTTGIVNRKSVPLLVEFGTLYQSSGKSQDFCTYFGSGSSYWDQ